MAILIRKKTYDAWVQELDDRENRIRGEIVQRVATARAHGDLSENAEYSSARAEQVDNEKMIAELKRKIANDIEIIKDVDTSFVNIGAKVKLYDETYDEENEYILVSYLEGDDVTENIITDTSPLGRVIIGKKVKDVVTIKSRTGEEMSFTILDISKED